MTEEQKSKDCKICEHRVDDYSVWSGVPIKVCWYRLGYYSSNAAYCDMFKKKE